MSTRAVRLTMLLVIFSASTAFGQTTTVDFGPTREDVMKLLDLTQARRNMLVAIENMKTQMKAGARQRLRTKLPNATPQQVARFDKIVEAAFSDFPTDEVFNAVIPVYQRHFTKQDLDGLIAFYSTPLGQKVIQEMPALLSESMQAGGEVGRRRMSITMKHIDEQIEEMRKEEQDSNQSSH